jgi:hypothetical protein
MMTPPLGYLLGQDEDGQNRNPGQVVGAIAHETRTERASGN